MIHMETQPTALLQSVECNEPPAEQTLQAKLARKKNRVIRQVQGIRKTGYNEYDEYAYVQEAEVLRCLRSALSKAGLSLGVAACDVLRSDAVPEGVNYTFRLTFTLTDTQTGYSEQVPWLAMGADTGDKAVCKAYTSGVKYFLLKTFLLPTDDDIEQGPAADYPPMEPVSAEIMTQLEGYFRRRTPEGARFDRNRFFEAVWQHFKAWPTLPAAAKRIQEVIDVRETVVWEGGKSC